MLPLRALSLAAVAAVLATRDATAQATGLDPKLPEQQKVIELLHGHRIKYGDDATILQGLLMSHAVGAGAVLATECGIDGFEETGGKKYVAYHLATGIIFDDRDGDRQDRLNTIWRKIIEASLYRYESFTLATDGIAVEISWNHKQLDRRSRDGSDTDDPGPSEHAKFYLATADVTELVARKLGAKDLLERSRVTIDGVPGTIDLDEIMLPPKPLPSELYKPPE